MAVEFYTLVELENAVKHALHGTPNSKAPATQIVNRSLTYLTKIHPWRWRTKNLHLGISATAITSMARSSNIVTVNQTAHGYSVGSYISIVGATTSFNGQFIVASTPTVDQFTFAQDEDDESAATPGSTIPGFVQLPADFSSIIAIKAPPGSQINTVSCAFSELFERRQNSNEDSRTIYYALNWLQQTSVSGLPRAVLEIHPIPQSASASLLTGSYMRIIPTLVNSTDVPDVPSEFHSILMVLCRAMAVSGEEDKIGTDWEIFANMVKPFMADDGASQGVLVGQMNRTTTRGRGVYRQFGRITS
jgi:hypothetical protein